MIQNIGNTTELQEELGTAAWTITGTKKPLFLSHCVSCCLVFSLRHLVSSLYFCVSRAPNATVSCSLPLPLPFLPFQLFTPAFSAAPHKIHTGRVRLVPGYITSHESCQIKPGPCFQIPRRDTLISQFGIIVTPAPWENRGSGSVLTLEGKQGEALQRNICGMWNGIESLTSIFILTTLQRPSELMITQRRAAQIDKVAQEGCDAC